MPANSNVTREYNLPASHSNILGIGVAAMGLFYLASCFTPLHLHFDSIRYFNIKDCIQYGCPQDSVAATDYLPYGYTALLIAMSSVGLLNSFSVVLVNCVFLFGSLFFISKIFRRQLNFYLYCIIVLFNWTIIKFSAHPLSEMQYIFFSSAGLYCYHLYSTRRNYYFLALALILGVLTVLTRSVGIALIPALIVSVLWDKRTELGRVIRKNKFLVILLIAIVIAMLFFLRQLKVVDYTTLLREPLEKDVAGFFAQNFQNHFTEIGEIFMNVPLTKVIYLVPVSVVIPFFVVAGLTCFVWFVYRAFIRKGIPFFIRCYLLFYCLIILNWPYYDPRFWVPILPLMVAIILHSSFFYSRWIFALSRVYLAGYLALGIFASAYSLYIGFDKEKFSKIHAAGAYRNEYESHFFGKPMSDTATHVDENVLEILRKYD